MSIKHNKMLIMMLLIMTSFYYGGCKSTDVPVNTPVTQMDNTNSVSEPDTIDNKENIEAEYANSTHSDKSTSATEISEPDDSEKSVLNDLFNAVSNNDIEKVKALIRKKVDLNVKDHKGHSVLFYANTVEMADFLIKHGAVIDNPDEFLYKYYREMIEDKHCNSNDIQLVEMDNFEENEIYQQKKKLKDNVLIEKSNLFLYFIDHIDHGVRVHGNFRCLKGDDVRIRELELCGETQCPRY